MRTRHHACFSEPSPDVDFKMSSCKAGRARSEFRTDARFDVMSTAGCIASPRSRVWSRTPLVEGPKRVVTHTDCGRSRLSDILRLVRSSAAENERRFRSPGYVSYSRSAGSEPAGVTLSAGSCVIRASARRLAGRAASAVRAAATVMAMSRPMAHDGMSGEQAGRWWPSSANAAITG